MKRISNLLLACCLATTAFTSGGCAQTLPLPPTSTPDIPASGALATRDGSVSGLRAAAIPLANKTNDYDELMKLVGDARFVLLGEATHGTHEFYRERARITQRLIREKGFTAVAIEGDWPDAYRVNRYVQGAGTDTSAERALSGFTRFPFWMWRNTDVRDLAQWLRQYNAALPATTPRAGFYGLDVYSLPGSIDAVVQHLEGVDQQAARRARERYRCFAPYRSEPEAYGLASLSNNKGSCEDVAIAQLNELQQRYDKSTGNNRSELFSALQNARVVKNAEQYYRVMYEGNTSSWNLRDRHMTDTLEALAAHLGTPGKPGKVVVWAHNSHVGDARTTTMGQSGEWTLGQLMRQRRPDDTVLVGFTTYTGTVMAASMWGERGKVQKVLPALPGSFAALFHDTGVGNFLLPLRGEGELVLAMGEPRLERAIGVVYLPQSERQSHYFQARMSKQFDAVIHLDETTAVKPLQP